MNCPQSVADTVNADTVNTVPDDVLAQNTSAPVAKTISSESFFIDIHNQDGTSAKVELKVNVGGKGISQLWDETARALFDFADVNGDVLLDESELANLVAPSAIQQIQWGQFSPVVTEPPKLSDIDRNNDLKIDIDELKIWYGTFGLGGISIRLLHKSLEDKVDAVIMAALDSDGDSILSEAEFRAARVSLSKFDRDQNYVIEMNELLSKDDAITKRPVAVLKPSLDGKRWSSHDGKTSVAFTVSKSLQVDQRLPGNNSELLGDQSPNDRAGGKHSPILIDFDLEQLRAPNSNLFDSPFRRKAEGICLVVSEWECETHDAYENFVRQATDRFLAVDVNQDGHVDSEEARAPHAFDMSGLLSVADRSKDGLLEKDELDRWFTLMRSASAWVAQINLVQHETRLFVALDVDGDGRLSQRELDECWSRIQSDFSVDSHISFEELLSNLPTCWSVELAGGKIRGSIPKRIHSLPYWFLGMDRNRDGDVSRLEFLGDDVAFNNYDRNNDGFISSAEMK